MSGMAAAYDSELLAVIRYEPDVAVAERKIRRRLREKGLGGYSQVKVDAALALKDAVLQTFDYRTSSPFHTPGSGKYASESDWDLPHLVAHLQAAHSTLAPESVENFVRWGLYYYYLR